MGKDQRRDVRVSTVLPTPMPMALPVFYQLLAADGTSLDAEIRTGLTQDISEKGLCLKIRHVPAQLKEYLQPDHPAGLRIELDLTLPKKRLRLDTRLAWVKREHDKSADSVLVGVEFLNLSEEHSAEIVSFAKHLARRPKIQRLVFATLSVLVVMAAGLLWWFDTAYTEERAGLLERTDELSKELVESAAQVKKVENQYKTIAATLDEQTAELNNLARDLRSVAGDSAGQLDGKSLIESVRSGLADVRRTIEELEEEVLADGTCVHSEHCGETACCTWRDGLCRCDDCCVDGQP